MNNEPEEDAISTVMAVIGISRTEAVQKLKANGNDTERAINAHYENPTGNEEQIIGPLWDESAFHSDKTKLDHQNQKLPSFNLRPPAETLGSNIFGNAPSRPPSRASHAGDANIVDLNCDCPKVASNPELTHSEREEQELQQAMALSMGNFPQESGVTPAPNPYFGPANREYYDSGKWAMTQTGSAHEIILNPQPSDRKREGGEPPFMKPSTAGHYLSSLITILHAIPLTREALLLREHVLNDYGFNDEWWDGVPVQVSRVVNVGDQQLDWEADEVLYETQRLMAFLDSTRRSYGSVDALANLKPLQAQQKDSLLANFLKAWQDAASRNLPGRDFTGLFRSIGVRKSIEEGMVEQDSMPFYTLDISVDEEVADKDLTLYAALDELIWSDTEEDIQREDTYLEAIGDIFVMKVSRQSFQGSGLGVHVPPVWYPDRYLERCKELSREMRINKAEIGKLIRQTLQIEKSVTEFICHQSPMKESKVFDARKLLETIIAYYDREGQLATDRSSEQLNEALLPQTCFGMDTSVVKELKTVYESVNAKLTSLEQQREDAHTILKDLSTLLTHQNDDPQKSPTEQYTLRGVSTDPQVTYVLCPYTDSISDPAICGWQWWKLTFTPMESKPVSKAKVREAQVLKAAREESCTALLVYASERATIGARVDELPAPLKKFVEADNRIFSKELDVPPSPVSTHPSSPKRKVNDSEENLIDLHPSPYSGTQLPPKHPTSSTKPIVEVAIDNPSRNSDSPSSFPVTNNIPETAHSLTFMNSYGQIAPHPQAPAPMAPSFGDENFDVPQFSPSPTTVPWPEGKPNGQAQDALDLTSDEMIQCKVPVDEDRKRD